MNEKNHLITQFFEVNQLKRKFQPDSQLKRYETRSLLNRQKKHQPRLDKKGLDNQ